MTGIGRAGYQDGSPGWALSGHKVCQTERRLAAIDCAKPKLGKRGNTRLSGIDHLRCTIRYSPGNTNSVSKVDDTIPPMTTVAKGR